MSFSVCSFVSPIVSLLCVQSAPADPNQQGHIGNLGMKALLADTLFFTNSPIDFSLAADCSDPPYEIGGNQGRLAVSALCVCLLLVLQGR
jgi:hypothetical protein